MSMSPQASKIFLRCQKYRAAGMAAPVWVPLSVEISTDPHMDQSSQQQYRVVRRTPPQHVAMNSEPSSWGWQAFIHHRLLGALSTHGSSLLCVVCPCVLLRRVVLKTLVYTYPARARICHEFLNASAAVLIGLFSSPGIKAREYPICHCRHAWNSDEVNDQQRNKQNNAPNWKAPRDDGLSLKGGNSMHTRCKITCLYFPTIFKVGPKFLWQFFKTACSEIIPHLDPLCF
jgi:hypothetical protein